MANVALENLSVVAKEALDRVPAGKNTATILALRGNLGAGKTTFVQALAKELGIEESVQSPTYVLMKSYPISYKQFKTLIHIDAYRLERPEEFAALKPDTFLSSAENLVCIEWPERVAGMMPAPDLIITFSAEGRGEKERSIELA